MSDAGMSVSDCAGVRDRLPEWVGGLVDSGEEATLRRHLEECPECRHEADLISVARAARPAVPAGLAERVKEAVRGGAASPERRGAGRLAGGRRPGWLPRWAAAAAVVALALGTGVLWRLAGPGADGAAPELALESVPEVWASDDGTLAGAPLLEALSEEELEALLEELGG